MNNVLSFPLQAYVKNCCYSFSLRIVKPDPTITQHQQAIEFLTHQTTPEPVNLTQAGDSMLFLIDGSYTWFPDKASSMELAMNNYLAASGVEVIGFYPALPSLCGAGDSCFVNVLVKSSSHK